MPDLPRTHAPQHTLQSTAKETLMALFDTAVLLAGAVGIWIGAAIVVNMILARIFGWKKDQR